MFSSSSQHGTGGGFHGSHRSSNLNATRVQSRSRTTDEPHIGKYKLLKTIGKGNFAKVCHFDFSYFIYRIRNI